MKKSFFALLILVSVPLFIRADPPKKLNLSYDGESKKLKIEAIHPVKNVNNHYIDLISISVDGKEVKVIKPQKQSDAGAEVAEVSIPQISKGCKVTVKARCNEFGSKTKSITIE